MERSQRAELLARFERASELPLIILALATVPLFAIPFFVDLSSTLDLTFTGIDVMIVAAFAIDLAVRVYLAERRLHYLVTHWYDVLIVGLPFLRPLRVVRSVRALRLARIVPYSVHATEDARELLGQRGLGYILALGVVLVFVMASLMFLAERGNGGGINRYDTAVWVAVETISTNGYGDVYPVTPEGRAEATFLMLAGLAFASFITAHIAAFLVQYGGRGGRSYTTADVMEKLEALERELKALRGFSLMATPSTSEGIAGESSDSS